MERQLIEHAEAHGLTPLGTLRYTYLEGQPHHKRPQASSSHRLPCRWRGTNKIDIASKRKYLTFL